MRDWTLPHSMTFEGQRVRYRVAGEGPPIVLMHGTPFSSVVWRRIEPLLGGARRVFCYDMLGYGQSDMRDGQDSILVSFPREWLRDPESRWLHDFPSDIPWDDPGVFRAMVALRHE